MMMLIRGVVEECSGLVIRLGYGLVLGDFLNGVCLNCMFVW